MTDAVAAGAAQRPWLSVHAGPPWVLHLAGELDNESAPMFTRALEDLAGHTDDIGLDLAGLTFIDSTGVRALCHAARLVCDRGRVTVFRPSGAARRIIEMSGLAGTIDINTDAPPTQLALTARSRGPLPRPDVSVAITRAMPSSPLATVSHDH